MGINTYEVMYIQAIDNYPYNVEECIEKLQYVIAADDEHAGAHFLMGRIYEEQLEDYKQAEYYYRMTLYLNREHLPVYYQYAAMLINRNRLDEALTIINAGLKAPGIDVARITYLHGLLYERYEMLNTAIEYYTNAKKYCLNSGFMSTMDDHIKRVKEKISLNKKSKKKEEKKQKTS
ncbi:hypothetical protein GR160_15105 [Flavobacterium sp. Sd200]|uniref:hypothetical protein n=1 Tax=Flavobacterium sp. Sd200 TaxID=2692211 RepID=UPI00136E5DA4|nr:hypothetical protein [Flavobacterium sp. Sd200]MXN92556.1 hypothetical protein [Flavobacterium sp. Sd200]